MSDSGPTRWVAIGRIVDLRFAPGAAVTVDGREIAVFPLPGGAGFCALDNSCPHAGGALAEGHLDGGEVSCPWHGWRFDLATGTCKTIAEDSTRAYRVREVDGVLEVELPA
ncbi:MAG TPA: Rieske 2Fe-2S domain-containing protein [Planctomycetota bacterium]|nr:Rieske 2Fe-2S domain-containing protein [Planctomycetota bacterium]